MCGHVGIAGKLEYKDEKIMKRLLIYDVFRGQDSTGLAALRKTGEVITAKVASHPIDLFDMTKFTQALTYNTSTVFLGHNRFATKGAVNGLNAHPFTFGHITGAHNGTLDASSWHAIEEAVGEKFDVDSQAIIAGIAKLGIEKTVKLLQGAWALVWINSEDDTINFLRNKERSFWYSFNEKCNKLFWASEHPMIKCAVESEGEELYGELDKEKNLLYKFFATQENMWYKFDITAIAEGTGNRPKPKAKELKGKEPAPVVHYTGPGSPFVQRTPGTPSNTNGSQSTSTTTSTTTSTGTSGSKTVEKNLLEQGTKPLPIYELTGTHSAPFGGVMMREEFNKLSAGGCSYCSWPLDYEQPGLVVYTGQEIILCPECASNDTTTTKIYVADV